MSYSFQFNRSSSFINGWAKNGTKKILILSIATCISMILNGSEANAQFASENYLSTNSEILIDNNIVEFKTILRGQLVFINWTSANEKDNCIYVIERSQNNEDFESIGIKHGTAGEFELFYSCLDEEPLQGDSHYRIKKIVESGEKYYSTTNLHFLRKSGRPNSNCKMISILYSVKNIMRGTYKKKHNTIMGRWLAAIFFLVCSISNNSATAQTNALFFADDSVGCVPFSVSFTNTSTSATNYHWDFGNGTTSSLANPNVVYVSSGTFTVTLIAENVFTGNSDTLTATNLITVAPDPIASFTAAPLNGCSNTNQIAFTNNSTGATSYSWDFGDGNGSTTNNPVHHYSNPGTYNVILIASNNTGCSDLALQSNYINIYDTPDATFSSNLSSSCDPNELFSFSTSDPGITSWYWDFGDGTTSTAANPSHTYGTTGSFDVTLIVSNSNACFDTMSVSSYINIGSSLVPSFTMNPATGCAPLSVQFNSTVPNAISWQWDFGDGSTDNTANPSHTYTSAGSYTLTLTVNTSNGCNGSVSLPGHVVVEAEPQSSFTPNVSLGCAPLTVNFNNTSTNATTYYWDFGDGATSNAVTPSHTFNNPGQYDVMLISTNNLGCTDTTILVNAVTASGIIADFTASPTIGCSVLPVNFTSNITGSPVNWYWNFGDGTTSAAANPSHNYVGLGDYDVFLIVSNALGCRDTIVRPAYISVVPDTTPYLFPDTINGCAPQPISFYDPTTGSNSWNWDFGDGDTSSQQNPTHVYLYPGTYTVNLNTGMAGGCTQDFNPYAIVLVDSFTIDENQIIQLTNCPPFQFSVSNPTIGVAIYSWNFGDGNTSNDVNPTHSYASSGTYVIQLAMTMTNGCVFLREDTVTVGYPNPIAASSTGICIEDTINFSLSNPGAWVSASWDFGDSASAVGLTTSHKYDSIGDYTITIDLIDTIGCAYTYTMPGVIQVRDPQPGFTITPTDTACDQLNVSFINNSTGANSYWWGFGNGSTSDAVNPAQLYSTPGNYNITLSAANSGCSRTITIQNAVVIHSATANFNYSQSSFCFPSTVQFTDSSVNAVSWFWNFGDGNTSDLQDPIHIYTSYPTAPVTLAIVDSNGCADTITRSLPFANSSFTVSDTVGCKPLTVDFTGNAVGAIAWQWDFGDGNTSSLPNPTNTYTNDGSYDVTLFITYSQGCVDTVHYSNAINVETPVAAFSSPTISNCAPSEVFFTNQSINAATYLWDFGDGVSSTEFEPSHIYTIPGYYTVTLIAYSPYGCSDTLAAVNFVEIPGAYAQFGYTPVIGCETFTAHFTDSSINASYWQWNFGDGSTSSQQNPSHVYGDTGTYVVSLFVSDTGVCNSFVSFPIQVTFNYFPSADATINNTGGCLPHPIQFTNNSSANSTVFTWSFGDGTTSNAISPTHVYNGAGFYYPILVATTSAGCVDTFSFTSPIEILQSPTAQFTTDGNTGCYGSTINFTNQSSGLVNPNFYWYFSDGSTSNASDPSLTLFQAGQYSVSLVVDNANGCSDSIHQANLITIADTIRPPEDTVLYVSVVDQDKVEIRWINSSENDLQSYQLYRMNGAGQYILIYEDLAPQTSMTAYSTTYIDSGLNTLASFYSYKLRTVDDCDQAVDIVDLNNYRTIELSALTLGQNVELNWNQYEGCPVSSYAIERTELPNGVPQTIASLAPGTTQFTDTTILCPTEYSYQVIATDLCGNTFASYSDTCHASPNHPIIDQDVSVSRSTVYQDQFVLTEWNAPTVLPDRVLYYVILRSEDNINFTPIGTAAVPALQYIDQTADVKNQQYYYRVVPVNDCQLSGSSSAIGNSILLQYEKPDDYHTILYWNRYEGWVNGVQNYVIEKQDENNNWQIIKVVPPGTTKVKLSE